MKLLNEKLLKNEALEGQCQDVVKLHEEIDSLKSILTKFVRVTKGLDKLLMYSRCPKDKSRNR